MHDYVGLFNRAHCPRCIDGQEWSGLTNVCDPCAREIQAGANLAAE